MGDGGDEFGLYLLRMADLDGEVVDGGYHLPHLVPVVVLDLAAVAPVGDPAGHGGDFPDGGHDIADENHVRQEHRQQQPRRDGNGNEGIAHHQPVHQLQAGHIADDAHDPPVAVDQRAGDCHDPLPGGGVAAQEGAHLLRLQSGADVLRAGHGAGGEAIGGNFDAPGGADELQVQLVPLVEEGGVAVGALVVFRISPRHIIGEKGGGGAGLGLQARAHAAVIIAAHHRGIGDEGKQGQQQHDGHAAEHPASSQTPDPEGTDRLPARHQKPHLYAFFNMVG